MTTPTTELLHPIAEADLAFHVVQHGIDRIPDTERWARPKDLGALWAGASVNVEYFVYGAILMGFGFSLPQAIGLIVVGNLSWLLVGLCSLQGPTTGTTTFGVNRAAFGPRGSRGIALFNWLTLIGFEAVGLILIVGAGIVLLHLAGIEAGGPTKVALVVIAVGIQAVLPYFGHATMTRVLRWMIVPFIVVFGVLAALSVGHAHLPTAGPISWQLWTAGLAFTVTLSGLSWTECGNDYSRYLPADVSPRATVGWVFLGTALPQTIIMTIGAVVVTFIGTTAGWNSANPFVGFGSQHVLPGWFVAAFMVMVIVQLFGINSLDLYSSGVTLQALGLRLKRHQAVLVDSTLCLLVTLYAVFSSSFSTLLRDFVSLVIIWIAPWCAIFLVDWLLRRRRYAATELQRTDPLSIYWAQGGVNVAAAAAQVAGMVAALLAINTAVPLPDWLHPITVATEADRTFGAASGADFSLIAGMGVAALTYLIVSAATGIVRRQRGLEAQLLDA